MSHIWNKIRAIHLSTSFPVPPPSVHRPSTIYPLFLHCLSLHYPSIVHPPSLYHLLCASAATVVAPSLTAARLCRQSLLYTLLLVAAAVCSAQDVTSSEEDHDLVEMEVTMPQEGSGMERLYEDHEEHDHDDHEGYDHDEYEELDREDNNVGDFDEDADEDLDGASSFFRVFRRPSFFRWVTGPAKWGGGYESGVIYGDIVDFGLSYAFADAFLCSCMWFSYVNIEYVNMFLVSSNMFLIFI